MPNVAELICESALNDLSINRKIKTIQCFLLFTLSILMSFFEVSEKENPVPYLNSGTGNFYEVDILI